MTGDSGGKSEEPDWTSVPLGGLDKNAQGL